LVKEKANMQTLKELIVERVESVQGCKGMELVTWIVSNHPGKHDPPSFPDTLNELVREGKLVEVAYSLPTMRYREKGFYLPAGKEVCIKETP
jgi:hypothetical protein